MPFKIIFLKSQLTSWLFCFPLTGYICDRQQSFIMHTNPDRVMVLADGQKDHIEIAGRKLYIDKSFDTKRHAVTTGRVIAVPSSPSQALSFLREGDNVVFDYLIVQPGSGYSHHIEGRDVHLIPESLVYGRLTDSGAIHPCGEYLVVEPELEPEEATYKQIGEVRLFIKPAQERVSQRGTVRYIGDGSAVEGFNSGWVNAREGDAVVFTKNADIRLPLEDRDMYIQRYRNIIARIVHGALVPMSDWVLVRKDAVKERTDTGLFLPFSKGKPVESGKVYLPGPGRYGVPVEVMAGEKILFNPNASETVAWNGEELTAIRATEIYAVYE